MQPRFFVVDDIEEVFVIVEFPGNKENIFVVVDFEGECSEGGGNLLVLFQSVKVR